MANHLVVQTFQKNLDRATEVFDNVKKMAEGGLIQVEAGAAIIRDYDGNVKVCQNSEWTAGSGAGWGGFWGLLIGLIFAGPVAGLLGGMGLGAILGGTASHKLDQDFMEDVAKSLKPGDSALFMAVPEEHQTETINKLSEFGGLIISTEISEEAQENLHKAVEHADLAAAAEQQAAHQYEETYKATKQAVRS